MSTSSTLSTLLLGNLGDVYHTFLARSKLKERAELFDADNFTFEYLSGLEVCHNGLDQRLALSIASFSVPQMDTDPSSSMSILTPVSSMMA